MKPSVVVTAADLDKIGTRVPEFYAGDLFCPVGKTPLYLGQPVALLIFETFDAFDQARLALRDGTFVKFGEETGPVAMPNYGAYRFTRVAGATPDAPDVYSPILAGWVSPGRSQNSPLPVWSPLAKDTEAAYAKAAIYGEQIRANLRRKIRICWCSIASSRPNRSIRCFSSRKPASPGTTGRATASNSCLACSRPTRRRSRSRICSARPALRSSRRGSMPSSPMSAAASAAATTRRSCSMWRWRRCSFPAVRSGWRMIAISSFRRGIKRHAFKMRSRIGVDRATGKIRAFAADHVLDGGGLANFSANVATVGATAAIGIYDVPKVDVTTVALHSRGVTAGSMRGYGTLQTMTALEVLIDEVAAALPLDPIEFRRRNALEARAAGP